MVETGMPISGNGQIGDLLLLSLNYLCRNTILLSRGSQGALIRVSKPSNCTFLIYHPDPPSKLVGLIDCTTRRGYIVSGREGQYADLFSSKAIYVGNSMNQENMPECGLHIVASMGAYERRGLGELEFT
jgi:hypothetical protein